MSRSLISVLAVLIGVSIYILFGYGLDRSETLTLFTGYGLLFGIYLWLTYGAMNAGWKWASGIEFRHLLGLAFLFRFLFLFSEPALSDDYFRFLFDGQLLINGYNPYLYLPQDLPGTSIWTDLQYGDHLLAHMNSPQYYTVYPPVDQVVYAASAYVGNHRWIGGVITMRCFILLAELGTAYFLMQILKYLGRPQTAVLWYLMNPLVIIELTGNLHFEAIMFCFLAGGIWAVLRGNYLLSGVWWALAIATKLIPLMFIPLLIPRIGWWRTMQVGGIAVGLVILMFLPFFSQELVTHFLSSIDLYFRTFEFNASFYYLVRWVGEQVKGYNIIAVAGPMLSYITMGYVIYNALKKRNEDWRLYFITCLLAIALYYLMATTVHPWYITGVLFCGGIVGNWKFPVVWTAVCILSYQAYAGDIFEEDPGLLFLAYAAVILFVIIDVRRHFFLSNGQSAGNI